MIQASNGVLTGPCNRDGPAGGGRRFSQRCGSLLGLLHAGRSACRGREAGPRVRGTSLLCTAHAATPLHAAHITDEGLHALRYPVASRCRPCPLRRQRRFA